MKLPGLQRKSKDKVKINNKDKLSINSAGDRQKRERNKEIRDGKKLLT